MKNGSKALANNSAVDRATEALPDLCYVFQTLRNDARTHDHHVYERCFGLAAAVAATDAQCAGCAFVDLARALTYRLVVEKRVLLPVELLILHELAQDGPEVVSVETGDLARIGCEFGEIHAR